MAVTGYVSIHPLNGKNLQSDHCEVALRTSIGIINSWNISNPAYHKFFSDDASQVFAQTNLADIDVKVLDAKIKSQLDTIRSRFTEGTVNIQVIVEGYETFFGVLAEKLSEGSFHLLAEKPDGWSATKNITGILVDTTKFDILESKVITVEYKESENEDKEAVLRVPYVHVQEIGAKKEMILAGVHIPGTASQYPKDGLTQLAKVIDTLWKEQDRKVDVIAVGDFNTSPECVEKHFSGRVLTTDYWTHANPRFPAASKYDMAIMHEAEEKPIDCSVLGLDAVSDASQALANGLISAIV